MHPTCLTCGRPVEEGETCCRDCLAPLVSAQAKVLRAKALTDALDRLEEAEKNIRMARAGLALALADLHKKEDAMKKYIFRRKKILSDGDVGIMSERMKWPVDCDGREAFFPDGKWEGYVDNPLGYRAIVYPEWCEVVEENEDTLTTAPNNDKEEK